MTFHYPRPVTLGALVLLIAAGACVAGTSNAFPNPNATSLDCRPPFTVTWTRPGEYQDIVDVDETRVYFQDKHEFGALALSDGRVLWRRLTFKAEGLALHFSRDGLIAHRVH